MLKAFKRFEVGAKKLREVYGENLHQVEKATPELVYAADVVSAIERYLDHTITEKQLLEWVNILWFTELYEYEPGREDAIADVMTSLESIDEKEISFSEEQYREMIKSLRYQCVFCGEEIEKGEHVTSLLVTENWGEEKEADQQLFCHLDCLRNRCALAEYISPLEH